MRKQFLRDPKVKAAYDALEPQYQVACQLIELRLKEKLTQRQLAARLGIKQSEMARLESGRRNPSIVFLQRLAKATGKRLQIRFT